MASPLEGLLALSNARTRRVSSYDRTGGNADRVLFGPGETFVLADLPGAGIVRHIWITTASRDPLSRRNMVLRVFVDGQDHPCVESPLGDFFGQGWGLKYNFASLPLACAPKDGHALVCYWPMPYGQGCRIEVENQGPEPLDAFYYYVDYEEHEAISDNVPRFHAWYNQEVTTPQDGVENEWGVLGAEPTNTTDAHNYLFCECEGRGHFVGVNYYVHSPGPVWYGEGDDMFLIDDELWPGLHGTGTEDYFNMSWCPDEVYMHPYFGCARAPGRGNDSGRFGWIGKTHVYRFHIEDPIRFQKSLRASIEHGHANVLTLDLASVAYWYQTLPTKPFPPLATAPERAPMPEIGVAEIHRWRDAWRRERGSGKLWGNEL
ncbi:MAG: DUF2961 domain-containing protein [Fimbriimonadaceae bacterium]|nr:DUF2961 domain-containing protein [Fimbriimonadaceae bacterium]QYK58123.1 MAG: DUF2961 domain-containing protein [Fimbriimonadaceae bacterium]